MLHRTAVKGKPIERRGSATDWVEREDFTQVLDLSWALKDEFKFSEVDRRFWEGEGLHPNAQKGCVRRV